MSMVQVEIEYPDELPKLALPPAVEARLQFLLDRQDEEGDLSEAERAEAEQIVQISELLSLLKLRAERLAQNDNGEG